MMREQRTISHLMDSENADWATIQHIYKQILATQTWNQGGEQIQQRQLSPRDE